MAGDNVMMNQCDNVMIGQCDDEIPIQPLHLVLVINNDQCG